MTRKTSLTAVSAKVVMDKKALIAMSGGMDSFVAAFLTKQMGYDCISLIMELVQNEDIGANRFRSAEKPDSQDICFVPCGDYTAFLERNTGRLY